jgi:hypothetical protein
MDPLTLATVVTITDHNTVIINPIALAIFLIICISVGIFGGMYIYRSIK